jgi:hypothetical protein
MNPHKLPEKRVNPYEAPSVLGPSIRAAEMGIGVWRDGDLIVLHNDAELPPFCIVTGVPTPLQAMIEATWCYRSFEFRWKRRQLAVPLADHRRVWIVNSQTAIAFCLIAGSCCRCQSSARWSICLVGSPQRSPMSSCSLLWCGLAVG